MHSDFESLLIGEEEEEENNEFEFVDVDGVLNCC